MQLPVSSACCTLHAVHTSKITLTMERQSYLAPEEKREKTQQGLRAFFDFFFLPIHFRPTTDRIQKKIHVCNTLLGFEAYVVMYP